MKKVILTIAMAAGIASAYCQQGTKINSRYVGGHCEVSYNFYNQGVLLFNFDSCTDAPFTMHYDFFEGHICFN